MVFSIYIGCLILNIDNFSSPYMLYNDFIWSIDQIHDAIIYSLLCVIFFCTIKLILMALTYIYVSRHTRFTNKV